METTEKHKPFLKENSFEEGFFHSQGTYVHPSSIIGKQVVLGNNVKIGPFCTIVGKVSIGAETRLHSHVSVGFPAQAHNVKTSLGSIEIGENCEIREFVTIGAPKIPSNKTYIGNDCYVMNFSHIAHDVTLENNVTLTNSVNIAGHVYVEHHVLLMANAAIHQYCRVGAYSALAPFSGVRQDVPPFSLFNGTPGKFTGLNVVGLRRANVSSNNRVAIKRITKLFFQDKLPFDTILKRVVEDVTLRDNIYVKQFLHFIENSTRGVSRKTINNPTT